MSKHIHIIGVCGTFMGGIAQLARQQGFQVTGSDQNVYPPMSTQLEQAGIELLHGFDASHIHDGIDEVIIGNALSRGNPEVEAVLNSHHCYYSGAEWLQRNILHARWVIGVAGTHGKTTTASMVAWILQDAGLNPGFLIGGVPANFGHSAQLGDSPFFVVEADEYDTAFFDKRSKFVHYHPKTLLINNLEFDHADIFDDLAAIQRQFHHLVRTVPGIGRIIYPQHEAAIQAVIEQGCWSECERLGPDGVWQAKQVSADGSAFDVYCEQQKVARLQWSLLGMHNVQNALGAIAATRHAGVTPEQAVDALSRFQNVARRMELKGCVNDIAVYDDFAHHPTAIATTVAGLKAKVGSQRVLSILEPRSNTMKMGVHQQSLVDSLQQSDAVFLLQPNGIDWDLRQVFQSSTVPVFIADSVEALVQCIVAQSQPQDHLLVMSNGGFGGIHQQLLDAFSK